MARNDGIDRTSVRNLAVSDKAVSNTQQHNEREKDSYRDLRNDVQPYLEALRRAPERVRNFFDSLLSQKPEPTMDAPSQKRHHEQNVEL